MTPHREAGMGKCGGGVPGAQADLPYITETCVNDHSGEHRGAGVSCEPLAGVNPACVDEELTPGRPLGRCTVTNQCQTFVPNVLDACKPKESSSAGAEGASVNSHWASRMPVYFKSEKTMILTWRALRRKRRHRSR